MRHLITAACLLGAVIAYVVGYGQPAVVFVCAGFLLESLFWIRLLRFRQHKLQPISRRNSRQL